MGLHFGRIDVVMDNKNQYSDFCSKEREIPIFSQPWWLDAVCGADNWNVILIRDNNLIVASFPYFLKKWRFGMKFIDMPILTQKLGIYIKYPDKQDNASRLSYEKRIFNLIIENLPKFDYFNVHFDYKYKNWLPFYWKGFNQTTRYTYLITDLSNSSSTFGSFSGNKKTDIRKASKIVTIYYDLDCNDFISYYSKSLAKQNDSLSYSADLIRRLHDITRFHNQGRIIYAVGNDNPNDIYGAIFYVWDNETIYSIITAFDPEFRSTSAPSLLFYQIMKDNEMTGLKFDFEGSMTESIENSYNKFGTEQVPYFRIHKNNSLGFKIYKILSEFKHEIIP